MTLSTRITLLVLLCIFVACPGQMRADSGETAKKEIERVLAAAQDVVSSSASAAQVAGSLRKIDLRKCPVAFREAFVSNIHDWEVSAEFARKVQGLQDDQMIGFLKSALRGLSGDIVGPLLDAMNLSEALQAEATAIGQDIRASYQQVEKVAVSHGADLRIQIVEDAKRTFLSTHSAAVAAAGAGDARAMVMLGCAYELSKDNQVLDGDSQATYWYRKAAEAGNVAGMVCLGQMYRDGRGVKQDGAEAIRWFRRAVDANNAPASFYLGRMYESGHGVTRDTVEAVRSYQAVLDMPHAGAEWQQLAKDRLDHVAGRKE